MPKAVSPLLAGVLLIAVTVGIATLTTGFISTTFRSTESAVSNKTADSVSCANAGIVIDDVYAKAGDNGTVAVPVRNSGFADLQLTSAQLYDKLGNNFSASGMPLSISRGQLLNLNFQLAKLANTTNDSSGYSNNANCTAMGAGDACSFTLSGKAGSAMSFDGINDQSIAADSGSLDIAASVTVEAWMKRASRGSFFILEKPDNYALQLVGSVRKAQFYFLAGGDWREVNSTSSLSAENWYHVAGQFNGTHLKVFVNGLQENTTEWAGSMVASNTALFIGSLAASGYYFNGTLDEVAVWNRSLSGEEINSTMLSGVTSINTTGLVGYWKFGEGRGVLTCSDFSQVVVTTNCGGISAAFDKTPKCS